MFNKAEVTSEDKNKGEYGKNEVGLIRIRKRLSELSFVGLGGILTACAYPDVNWNFCGWIGLIPLVLVAKEKRVFAAWTYGFVWGLVSYIISFFWIREIEPFIPFLLAPVLALFPAFWAVSIPFLYRYLLIPIDIQLRGEDELKNFFGYKQLKGILFTVTLGCLWCFTEWIRSWIFTGFPWNFLGVTQWKNIPLIQICEYTGIYGVSFIIAIINISGALALQTLYKSLKAGKYIRPVPFMGSLVILMSAVLIGYKLSAKYNREGKGILLRVAVIQGNIPQCRQATEEETVSAIKEYIELSELAVKLHPDIVIWPETAVPIPLRGSDALASVYRFKLLNLIKKSKVPFLIGSLDFGQKVSPLQKYYPLYNSALFIGADCKLKDKYYKVHLVPFGEYVPFSRYFPKLRQWIGMGRDLTSGKEFNPIEIIPGVKAGIEICFEDVFPYISVNHAYNGANLMIVLSNDAWYPVSSEPMQHLVNAIFRTIETRRYMIRSGNNCCSVLINPNGEIIDSLSSVVNPRTGETILLPEKKSKGFAVFTVRVPENPSLTFFTKYPYGFILLCVIIALYGVMEAIWAWRQKKLILSSHDY